MAYKGAESLFVSLGPSLRCPSQLVGGRRQESEPGGDQLLHQAARLRIKVFEVVAEAGVQVINVVGFGELRHQLE
jgi:hypothetical protein